jgi:hypothetical protein
MPVMEETVVQPAEQPLPAETPDVQEQLPLHDNPDPEAAAHQAAELPLEEHAPEPAAIVEHVEPVPEHAAPMPVESVTAHEPGEAVGHEAVGHEAVVHTETEAAHDDQSPIIIEHSATQAPPLDPVGAMAAAAPHEEHAPPA